MSIPMAPRHLKHYVSIARLLVRHWDPDWTDPSEPETTSEYRDDSRSLADDLEELGPTYVKLGQLLSTRPDVMPQRVCEDLSRLQDRVGPVPLEQVKEIIQEELGTRLDNLFEEFDVRPLAAASLGQVHRATLRGGRRVAVKVQRPGIDRQVREDLEVLEEVVTWLANHTDLEARYGLVSTLREVRDAVLRELDYKEEARNLERLGDALEAFDQLIVPQVVEDYSTGRVLTMELVEGTALGRLSPVARLDHDLSELADTLFRAYLDQALLHGFVHADPHPGNLLLTPDGRLAIIDLGLVAYIPDDLQERLLRMLLAIAEGDGSEAASIAERVGVPLDTFDRTAFQSAIAELVAREGGKAVGSVQVGSVLTEVAQIAGSTGLRLPSQVGLLGKTLLNLESVGKLLDPEFDAAASVRAHAPMVITERLIHEATPGALFRRSLEVKRFVEGLPGRVDALLDRIADGRFRVRVEINGEERIVRSLTRMANRITTGLVLAALIVGASLLVRIETDFTLFGYPGLAIILFLLAAVGSVALLWNIWRTEPKT